LRPTPSRLQLTAVVPPAPHPTPTSGTQFTPKGGPRRPFVASDTQFSPIPFSYVIPQPWTVANVGAIHGQPSIKTRANVPRHQARRRSSLWLPTGNNPRAWSIRPRQAGTQNACNNGTTSSRPSAGVGLPWCRERWLDGKSHQPFGDPPTARRTSHDPRNRGCRPILGFGRWDLGSKQSFNTVVITWEGRKRPPRRNTRSRYTNADPATNPVWSIATTKQRRAAGRKRRRFTFPTVQARDMCALLWPRSENTQYGYSLYEFPGLQTIALLGASTERYSTSPAQSLAGLWITCLALPGPAPSKPTRAVRFAVHRSGMPSPTAQGLNMPHSNAGLKRLT